MSVFQTQCPTCQHSFAITEEQLNLKNGYARCGSCKAIFPANQHIIGVISNPASNPVPNVAKPAPTPASSDDDLTLLFDDSAGLDEDGKLVKHEVHKSEAYQGKKARASASTEANFDILDNFDDLDIPLSKPTKPQHISQDQNYDEDWAKNLLASEVDNTPTRQQSFIVNNNNANAGGGMGNMNMGNMGASNVSRDMDNMLQGMGVNVVQERMPTTQEYQQKINARFENQQSQQEQAEKTSMGMNVVWVLGSLLLGAILLGQYVFFNVDNLVKNPDNASKIAGICGIIPTCKLPIADTSQLDIKSQSLVAKGEKSDLIFTIQNKSSEKAIYPNLKVSLRDGNEVYAQFVVTPKQYLLETDGKYLPAQQVHPVKLRIDTASKKSAQANIEAFY